MSLEIGTRVANGQSVVPATNYVSEAIISGTLGLPVVRHHPIVGWVHVDNFNWTPGRVLTGEFGVRMNSDTIEPLARGATLAVGDSFTAGSEVANSESWPAQLQKLTGEPVINAAVGGWGVDQIVLRAEDLFPELRPHTLILGILAEDSIKNTFSRYGGGYKPYFNVVDGALQLQNSPVPGVRKTPRELGYLRSVLGHSYFVWWAARRMDMLPAWADDRLHFEQVHTEETGVQISCLLMPRLAELSRRTGARVLLVFEYGGTSYLESEQGWIQKRVVDCARTAGLETLDTREAFREVARRDMDEFRGLFVMRENNQVYGHMSARGNRLIAELIRGKLLQDSAKTASAPEGP